MVSVSMSMLLLDGMLGSVLLNLSMVIPHDNYTHRLGSYGGEDSPLDISRVPRSNVVIELTGLIFQLGGVCRGSRNASFVETVREI